MAGPQIFKLNDLKRERILKLWREGLLKVEIAKRLNIHPGTVSRIIKEVGSK